MALVLIAILFSSLFLAYVTFFVVEQSNLYDLIRFSDDKKFDRELFSRMFVLWMLLLLSVLMLKNETVQTHFISQRRHQILLLLFGLGALSAVADPKHSIPSEDNWIRYWTAGVLVAAGALAVWSSLRRTYPTLDRLFGAAFGLLLFAAAGDELFQFHERSAKGVSAVMPQGSLVHAQDMTTLSVAVVGFVGLVVALLIARAVPRTRYFFRDPRYRRTILLLFLGVSSFLAAMILDTFAWYLDSLVDPIRTAIWAQSGVADIPHWFGEQNIAQAANALEELLEYAAALLFFLAIGTAFSIRALGCDLMPAAHARASSHADAP